MADRLEARVALVTGGCSGIGLATVELFIAEGASVVIADVQDEKGAALEMRFSGRAIYRHCDVTREADIEAAVAAAKESFGGLDILFNNAGAGGVRAGIADMPVDGWDETQALLLRGPMLGMKHAVPLMIERGGGSIINTASIAGLEAGGGLPMALPRRASSISPGLRQRNSPFTRSGSTRFVPASSSRRSSVYRSDFRDRLRIRWRQVLSKPRRRCSHCGVRERRRMWQAPPSILRARIQASLPERIRLSMAVLLWGSVSPGTRMPPRRLLPRWARL